MKIPQKYFLFLFAAFTLSEIAWAGDIMVQSCNDGDTCAVQVKGLSLKVRLAGIDAPEMGKRGAVGQPYAREAKDFLNQCVAGKNVQATQYGIDAFNRPLVELTMDDGKVVNELLVQGGLAEVYGGRTRYDTGHLIELESQAKRERKGMWSLGSRYVSPYLYRKNHRTEQAGKSD